MKSFQQFITKTLNEKWDKKLSNFLSSIQKKDIINYFNKKLIDIENSDFKEINKNDFSSTKLLHAGYEYLIFIINNENGNLFTIYDIDDKIFENFKSGGIKFTTAKQAFTSSDYVFAVKVVDKSADLSAIRRENKKTADRLNHGKYKSIWDANDQYTAATRDVWNSSTDFDPENRIDNNLELFKKFQNAKRPNVAKKLSINVDKYSNNVKVIIEKICNYEPVTDVEIKEISRYLHFLNNLYEIISFGKFESKSSIADNLDYINRTINYIFRNS